MCPHAAWRAPQLRVCDQAPAPRAGSRQRRRARSHCAALRCATLRHAALRCAPLTRAVPLPPRNQATSWQKSTPASNAPKIVTDVGEQRGAAVGGWGAGGAAAVREGEVCGLCSGAQFWRASSAAHRRRRARSCASGGTPGAGTRSAARCARPSRLSWLLRWLRRPGGRADFARRPRRRRAALRAMRLCCAGLRRAAGASAPRLPPPGGLRPPLAAPGWSRAAQAVAGSAASRSLASLGPPNAALLVLACHQHTDNNSVNTTHYERAVSRRCSAH